MMGQGLQGWVSVMIEEERASSVGKRPWTSYLGGDNGETECNCGLYPSLCSESSQGGR